MIDLSKYETEKRNPKTYNLDMMSALQIVTMMNNEDVLVPLAIAKILPDIAAMVDCISAAFEKGGRLVYMGAGTSGRLGVLDASECPPTYGVDSGMVVGLIAGGDVALRNSREGSEDDYSAGKDELVNINLRADDVVVGIAASGRTPYVLGGLEYAKSIGCKTGAIACNLNSEIGKVADIRMEAAVGQEVLTGSTRLKSGTAQKLILNMLTTASMVRIGKAYQNLMVDVQQTNDKLVVRAQNIVMDATGVDREAAAKTIDEANGSVKVAIVMILADCDVNKADELLKMAKGHVRDAIKLNQ